MQTVAQGILRTLVWFDQFDFPLTQDELWRWWYGPRDHAPAPDQVAAACRQLMADGRVSETGGFFHLPNRSMVVALRLERRQENAQKWHRAERAVHWLQSIPFLRFVAVCNTVAISNARPDSDIDVFIVVRRDRLWFTRFWVTFITSLLGVRRRGKRIANQICLSFFVTDTALDFSPLLLQPEDPYFAFWVDQLVPLYDPENLLAEIRRLNTWVLEYLPNAFSVTPRPRIFSFRAAQLKHGWEMLLGGWLGDRLESLERLLQQGKMRLSPNAAATGAAVMTDDVLKFHEQDRRAEYRQRFKERCAEVLGEGWGS